MRALRRLALDAEHPAHPSWFRVPTSRAAAAEWAWQHGEQPDAETRRVIEDEAGGRRRALPECGRHRGGRQRHAPPRAAARLPTCRHRRATSRDAADAARSRTPRDQAILPSEAELAAYLVAHAGTFAEPSDAVADPGLLRRRPPRAIHSRAMRRPTAEAAPAREGLTGGRPSPSATRSSRGLDCARGRRGLSSRRSSAPEFAAGVWDAPGRHVDRTGPVLDLRAAPGVACRAYPRDASRHSMWCAPRVLPVDAVRAPRRARERRAWERCGHSTVAHVGDPRPH